MMDKNKIVTSMKVPVSEAIMQIATYIAQGCTINYNPKTQVLKVTRNIPMQNKTKK